MEFSFFSDNITQYMQPIDQNKVNIFLATLNAGRPINDPLWVEIEGVSALMKMGLDDPNKIVFHTNIGFPTKAFINTLTGELKLVSARVFSQN